MTEQDRGGNLLQVKVAPNARRSEIAGLVGDVLQIKVAAPPEKGRANRELVTFLSRKLGVSISAIAIVRGPNSRHKTIAVDGLGRDELVRRLTA